ncbi:MAG: type II toxin-antitoxin system RelE/ParE family toxin [Lachnospiraceae bacterium]|jgi:toxin ParE1/3/4|nr:type II toxin-antitoxin system RelE/ParE family toxin [Lachnospiraceae bacterium]MCI9661641.1 type II toxin-antitoxin system RelE/ParE family toxin [Lachnospiraceae bacterium]
MTNEYNITYSPESVDDLKRIYSYIAFDLSVPSTAENQINRIREKVGSLTFMPLRHTIVDWEPWRSMEMHQILVDKYIVYYMVNVNIFTVTIVRIVYSGMDVERFINLWEK